MAEFWRGAESASPPERRAQSRLGPLWYNGLCAFQASLRDADNSCPFPASGTGGLLSTVPPGLSLA